MSAPKKDWWKCLTVLSERQRLQCHMVVNTSWHLRRRWLQNFRYWMENVIRLQWWVMAWIHILPAGVHIMEQNMQCLPRWPRLLLPVGIIKRFVLRSRNTSNVWRKTVNAGESRWQLCLVLTMHRWNSVFRQLVEKTVCRELSMILMFHRHCAHLLWMWLRFPMLSHRNWKKQEMYLYVCQSAKMRMIFRITIMYSTCTRQ